MTDETAAARDQAEEVMDALRRYRMAHGTERELQSAIAEVLHRVGIPFEREAAIGPGERPDFLLGAGVALEVKVQGAPSAIVRQLRRYAEHERVRLVLLVTSRHDHRPPDVLEGKPVLTLCVGSAFL